MSIRTNRQKPMMVQNQSQQPPMGNSQRPSALKQRPPVPQPQRPVAPIQQQQMQQQQPEKQQKPKMSIGDAIGLITIRLSRVEIFIQQLQTDGIDMSSVNSTGTSTGTMDNGMIQNLVSRLNTIEDFSSTKEKNEKLEQPNDLKDTKDLLMKLMLKFENFTDDTLARFEDQHQLQQTLVYNLELLQQPEPEQEVVDTTEQETLPTPSNESEPVPSPSTD